MVRQRQGVISDESIKYIGLGHGRRVKMNKARARLPTASEKNISGG